MAIIIAHNRNHNHSPNWGYFTSSLLKSFNVCMIRSENDLQKMHALLLASAIPKYLTKLSIHGNYFLAALRKDS